MTQIRIVPQKDEKEGKKKKLNQTLRILIVHFNESIVHATYKISSSTICSAVIAIRIYHKMVIKKLRLRRITFIL